MLELRNLTVGYAREPVLRDFNLALPDGGFTALIGPNGCGKSTLLRTACGLLQPSEGQVLLDGEPLPNLAHKAVARKLAFLPQSRPVPDLTARRLVLHGRFPYLGYPRRYSKADYAAADAALAAVGAQALAERDLQALSGGERQKVFLAMALAQDAPTILLDEPTTYLDIGRQFEILDTVRALRKQGKTILMVLHDLPQALETADRLAVFDAGRLLFSDTPQRVLESGVLQRTFSVRIVPVPGGWYCCQPLRR